jgi:hypothetical protein
MDTRESPALAGAESTKVVGVGAAVGAWVTTTAAAVMVGAATLVHPETTAAAAVLNRAVKPPLPVEVIWEVKVLDRELMLEAWDDMSVYGVSTENSTERLLRRLKLVMVT